MHGKKVVFQTCKCLAASPVEHLLDVENRLPLLRFHAPRKLAHGAYGAKAYVGRFCMNIKGVFQKLVGMLQGRRFYPKLLKKRGGYLHKRVCNSFPLRTVRTVGGEHTILRANMKPSLRYIRGRAKVMLHAYGIHLAKRIGKCGVYDFRWVGCLSLRP